jgi:hypothetical protein
MQFTRSWDEQVADKEQTYRWLKFGDIKSETVSTIVAPDDQTYEERRNRKEMLCKKCEGTVDHLTSRYTILARNEYIIRHTCTLLNRQEIRHLNSRELVKHTMKAVCEHEYITVIWNGEVKSDREVLANRTDIIIKNERENFFLLIRTSDRNVIRKKAEKKLKYKILSTEIDQMWNMK